MDFLQPEYNLLKVAASLQGFKHSPETIAKLRAIALSPKRLAKLNKIHSSFEHKEHLKRLTSSSEHKERLNRIKKMQSQPISVLDTTNNVTTNYSSLWKAARAIGLSHATISNAFKRKGELTVWIKNRQYKITKLT